MNGGNHVESLIGMKGIVTFRNFLLESPRAIEIDNMLREAEKLSLGTDTIKALLHEMKQMFTTKELVRHNLVVATGRNLLAGILNGETTYTGAVNYGALGTGSAAVASTDTQLGTEVARKALATRTRTNSTVGFDFYYSKADTNGTYQEFGTFIDGTASANTGQMLNRVLTGGWTKSSLEAMTVSLQLDINA